MNKRILILEVGDKFLKICQSQLGRKSHVDYLEVIEYPQEITSKDIENMFLKFSKIKFEKILISIHRSFFLMRFLRLPSCDREEIKRMLPFQLAKIIPHSLEEIIYDFSYFKLEDGSSRVTLFFIHEKRMNFLWEFFKKNKITPYVIMSSAGLNSRLVSGKLKRETLPFTFIDIDKYAADFLVIDKGNLLFSRSFPYENDEEILQGIQQSLSIFEKEFGKQKFAKVIFTGNRKENVLKNLNIEENVFMNYWDDFPIEKKLRERFDDESFSLAGILGSSIDGEDRFDFSPKFLKKRRENLRKREKWWGIGILSLEIVLIAAIFIFKYAFDKSRYLDFLNSKVDKIKAKAEELDKISDKLSVMNKASQREAAFSEKLHQVFSSIPNNAKLALLDFQRNGEFSLKGYADGDSDAIRIVSMLNKLSIFKEVKIKYVSKVKQNDKVMVEFYINGKAADETNSF